MTNSSNALRWYSKILAGATLFLIFAGSLVTSTDSGLSVPDWPLSYGSFFPPMVGGVFYEHGHRMIATAVGFMTLCLGIWAVRRESQKWLKTLVYLALGAVVLQGLLGGITVLFYLPTAISVSHALLGQTFLILTVAIAFFYSREWSSRVCTSAIKTISLSHKKLMRWAGGLFALIYFQLLLGALMRHTGSGLAVPDFPAMGGRWWPVFTDSYYAAVNAMRSDLWLDPVKPYQIGMHLLHRLTGFVILLLTGYLTWFTFSCPVGSRKDLRLILLIDIVIIFQICLGVMTIWTGKSPYVASAHVLVGALSLALASLLMLRIFPVENYFKK